MSSCSDEEGTEGGGHCGGVGGYSYGWIFFFVGFLLGQFVCCCLFLFFSKFVSNISSSGFIISLISIISRLISIIIRLCRLGDSCTSSEVSAFGIFVVSFLLLSSSTGGNGLSFEKVDSLPQEIVFAKFLAPQTLSLSLVPAAYWVTKPVVFQIWSFVIWLSSSVSLVTNFLKKWTCRESQVNVGGDELATALQLTALLLLADNLQFFDASLVMAADASSLGYLALS